MTSKHIKRASLADIRKLKDAGALRSDDPAIEDDVLSAEFWDKAEVVEPQGKKSVHLKLDAEVFDFFKEGGKGHLTRMQAVLAAYVQARRQG